jgi:DNA repair protein RadC
MPRRLYDLSPSQRPRQRLAELGPWALSDAELLAVLLGARRCGKNAVQESAQVLADAGGLAELAKKDVEELMAIPGFGKARATALVAAVELGRRMVKAPPKDTPGLLDAETVGEYLVSLLQEEQREMWGFLSLDCCHRQITRRELMVGDGSKETLDDLTTALLRQAILDRAVGIMLFHHKVGGVLEFGGIEIGLTQRLVKPCMAVGVRLLDTFVVSGGSWVSLRRKSPLLYEAG